MTKKDFERAQGINSLLEQLRPYLKAIQGAEIASIELLLRSGMINSAGAKYFVNQKYVVSVKKSDVTLGPISIQGKNRICHILESATKFIQQVYVEEVSQLEKEFEKLGKA